MTHAHKTILCTSTHSGHFQTIHQQHQHVRVETISSCLPLDASYIREAIKVALLIYGNDDIVIDYYRFLEYTVSC